MRYILLGGTGFIGSAIAKIFQSKPLDIICLNRRDVDLENRASVRALSSLINENTNLIMTVGVKKQYGDNLENWCRNEKILTNFLSAISAKKPNHVLYLSSAAVYGESPHFSEHIVENSPVEPDSYYAISKINAEHLLRKVASEYSFPLCIARPPLIYGLGDKSLGYGPTQFCFNAVHDKVIKIWGEGDELREFIHIRDLAKICFLLSTRRSCGTVNTVSGRSHTFMDVLGILQRISSDSLNIEHRRRSKEKIDIRFSCKALNNLIGDFDHIPLQEGVQQLYSQFKERDRPNAKF